MNSTAKTETFDEWYSNVQANLKTSYQSMIDNSTLTSEQVELILTAHRQGAFLAWLRLGGK